ncbi:hypothetical protein Tco_0116647 [Tanacetum coccineum]
MCDRATVSTAVEWLVLQSASSSKVTNYSPGYSGSGTYGISIGDVCAHGPSHSQGMVGLLAAWEVHRNHIRTRADDAEDMTAGR